MTAKDIICLTLGIGTSYNTLDDICENFDVELTCELVEQAISECEGDYSGVMNVISERLIRQCLDEYGIELYENGWSADINGDVVRLYHNNEIVANRSEIEDIVNTAFNDAKFKANIEHLSENDIIWRPDFGESAFSGELECYTPAGEDMFITLEVVDKEHLQDYINNFDINENVSLWWPHGEKAEGMGVPFDNMKEHYEDYEEWLTGLQEVCDGMPY